MSSPPSLSPLSLRKNFQSFQCHSNGNQPYQTQSPRSYPFEFPLRVIPPVYDKHPGPRPPLEAYKQAQRWIDWHADSDVAGFWRAEWRKLPTHNDVSLLVEEMVLRGILPECFSTDAGDQEEATARIETFNNGAHNDLYTLHCRCCPESKEQQAAEVCSTVPVPSQSCSKVESRKPLNSSSPHTSPGYRSTLLQHGDCGGTSVEEDKFDNCHIPEEILLRLSLPLDPYFHMESDVATAHFARVRGIPVPRIYAYDSSAVNCLGIEWQLVQKIPDPDVNFVDEILDEEEEFLAMCGKDRPRGQSAAWTRLGRQLEETLALLRSGNHRHPHQGRGFGACFDKIGSLYWDFEKCDFVLGPVSDRFFIRGRRILYHQRHDGDGGDPKLPLHRGPFDSVDEYLNAALTMYLEESNDETLRVDEGQSNLSKSPASSEAGRNTATTTAVTDTDCCSEDDDPPRLWYTEADVEIVHDQVSKLRDIVIPWLVAKLTTKQQEQMRTYISHLDLHSQNLMVSRRAQTKLDSDESSRNVLGEEYAISAVLDWEHTVALPDYFIHPVDISRYFTNALPTTEYPACSGVGNIEGYLEDALDGGRAARSPWKPEFEIPGRFAPEGLVPWRSGYDPRDDGVAAAASAGGCGNGCASNVDGVRVGASDMEQREATTNSFMTPPRQLTNAEVLLFIVFDCIDDSVGRWSEELVNPLVEWIQTHSASEGET